MNGCTLPITVT